MNAAGPRRLAALEQLLARQAQAVEAGDADALPALAEPLRAELAALLRDPQGLARDQLAALQRQCLRTQALLARRQQQAERSLQALAAGAGAMREQQAQRVYAAAGGLTGSPWRGRGLGCA